MELDLFGAPVRYQYKGNGKKGRNADQKGYAARPGSGPKDETCRSCINYHVKPGGRYRKCLLIQKFWTRGSGTDIKASSPACKFWEKKEG